MSNIKQCPFCGENIKMQAIKCKHCGEFMSSGGDKITEKKAAPRTKVDTVKKAASTFFYTFISILWFLSALGALVQGALIAILCYLSLFLYTNPKTKTKIAGILKLSKSPKFSTVLGVGFVVLIIAIVDFSKANNTVPASQATEATKTKNKPADDVFVKAKAKAQKANAKAQAVNAEKLRRAIAKELADFKSNKATIFIDLDRLFINKDLEGIANYLDNYKTIEDKELQIVRENFSLLALMEKYTKTPNGQYDARLSLLQELLKKQPDSIEYQSAIVNCKADKRKSEISVILGKVRVLFNKAKKTKPEYKQLIGLTDTLIKLGHKPTEMKKSIKKFEDAFKKIVASEKAKAKANLAKKTRLATLKRGFSVWDGSHNDMVRLYKKNMNDPDSFEHVETKFIDKGKAGVFLFMKCRGKNTFGGKILVSVNAIWSIEKNTVTFLTN